MGRKRGKVKTVALKCKTYERLTKYKIWLIKENEDPRITFDQVINALLDKWERRRES